MEDQDSDVATEREVVSFFDLYVKVFVVCVVLGAIIGLLFGGFSGALAGLAGGAGFGCFADFVVFLGLLVLFEI